MNFVRFLGSTVLLSCLAGLALGCVRRSYNSTPNIVSGTLVEENDPIYAATVSLDSNGSPFCSGFLFDKRTVVTAAHCLASAPGRVSYTVTFGSKNRGRVVSVEVPAKQTLGHIAWDRGDLGRKDIDPLPQYPKGDVGLLVLSEDAPDWVKPIPVKEIGEVSVGRDLILAGYGQTRELPRNGPPAEIRGFLRQTKVKLAVINDAGRELIWEAPSDNPRASSCHGDSGGPMFFVENDGQLTVIGVTSRSYSSALDCQTKGVYTDVRKYTEWIRQNRDRIAAGIISSTDWQHRYFTALDGTKIALDYQLTPVGPEYLSREVWLNVYNPSFTGKEEVVATLSSYINALTQQKLKMEYAGEHRYTVKFDRFKDEKVCALASRWGVKQDVTIDVGGTPLADSVAGGGQFNFKFCE